MKATHTPCQLRNRIGVHGHARFALSALLFLLLAMLAAPAVHAADTWNFYVFQYDVEGEERVAALVKKNENGQDIAVTEAVFRKSGDGYTQIQERDLQLLPGKSMEAATATQAIEAQMQNELQMDVQREIGVRVDGDWGPGTWNGLVQHMLDQSDPVIVQPKPGGLMMLWNMNKVMDTFTKYPNHKASLDILLYIAKGVPINSSLTASDIQALFDTRELGIGWYHEQVYNYFNNEYLRQVTGGTQEAKNQLMQRVDPAGYKRLYASNEQKKPEGGGAAVGQPATSGDRGDASLMSRVLSSTLTWIVVGVVAALALGAFMWWKTKREKEERYYSKHFKSQRQRHYSSNWGRSSSESHRYPASSSGTGGSAHRTPSGSGRPQQGFTVDPDTPRHREISGPARPIGGGNPPPPKGDHQQLGRKDRTAAPVDPPPAGDGANGRSDAIVEQLEREVGALHSTVEQQENFIYELRQRVGRLHQLVETMPDQIRSAVRRDLSESVEQAARRPFFGGERPQPIVPRQAAPDAQSQANPQPAKPKLTQEEKTIQLIEELVNHTAMKLEDAGPREELGVLQSELQSAIAKLTDPGTEATAKQIWAQLRRHVFPQLYDMIRLHSVPVDQGLLKRTMDSFNLDLLTAKRGDQVDDDRHNRVYFRNDQQLGANHVISLRIAGFIDTVTGDVIRKADVIVST